MNNQLLEIREEIDQIDHQILMLLEKRANLCIDALLQKQKKSMKIYDPKCEANKIQKICTINNSQLSNTAITNIFLSIIQECRDLQILLDKK
jgi:chorismate mutase